MTYRKDMCAAEQFARGKFQLLRSDNPDHIFVSLDFRKEILTFVFFNIIMMNEK